jgi:hypothetical protein
MSVGVTIVLRSMTRRWGAGDEELHNAYTPDSTAAELVS